jgi:hypothetical protein|tara:strand:+ start:780 stop:1007 length:228 start_codon:yes stop_codon:yes gene_type:complete
MTQTSYDVLIWNKEDLGEMPYSLHNVDDEYIDLDSVTARQIYEDAEFAYFRQLIEYESSDEDSSGEVILEGGVDQ